MPDNETTAGTISSPAAEDDVDAILAQMASIAEQAESTAAEDQEWSPQQVDTALDEVQEHIAELEHLVESNDAGSSIISHTVLDDVSDAPFNPAEEDDDAGPRIVDDDAEEPTPDTSVQHGRNLLVSRIRRAARKLAAIGVEAVLVLDLPFSALSPMIKSLCGYIALVTLTVAIAAWLIGPRLVHP